jgi:hypothetical protein
MTKIMKHLMRYEGYTSMERVDDILDKISKYGIKSLTQLEKDFLDSHKIGNEEEIHDKLAKEESETVFEDDNGYFKFEHTETEDYGDEVHYIGTLYVPDLEWPNGKRLEGRLEGKIVVYSNGSISPDFYSVVKDPQTHDNYDVFEFCNGLEYELDSFRDYVVSELDDKNKDL